jgi:hypothetical protein
MRPGLTVGFTLTHIYTYHITHERVRAMRAATGTFLTLLHRHHALKTSGSTASLSSHAKQAQLTLSNVLNKFRGTVLEAMSKTLPEKDRVWLAER